MKFFKLVNKNIKAGDILGYESRDDENGMLLKPTPISFIHNDSKYNIAEVKPIGRLIPNGELSGMYYAECLVIMNIFNTKDIIELYDKPEWIYTFLISTHDTVLKDKAFEKLYYMDKDCKYLLKYIKNYGKNKCKVLTKLMAEDKTGDLIYKFGLYCKEYASIVQDKLIEVNNLELLVEYSKYVDNLSAWKIQTILLSNNTPPDILMEFAIHNVNKEIDLEAIGYKIYETGGEVDRFYARFDDKIEKSKDNKWWDVG